MKAVDYLRDNLAGAWLVMFGRPQGLGRLDVSLEGFWRSFALLIVVAPLASLSLLGQDPAMLDAGVAPAPLTGGLFARYAAALLVDWLAFPLVFALLAPSFGLGSRYVPFIVARNWASVVIAALVAIVDVARIFGALPPALVAPVGIVIFAMCIRLMYVLTRTTLAISMAMALPIVALDFLLSLVIWGAFRHLLYPG